MSQLVEKITLPIVGKIYAASKDAATIESMRVLQEPLEKLYQLEQLEKKELLVKLPCPVDSEVYYIDDYEGAELAEIVRGVVDGYLWFRSCGFALNCVWDKPIKGESTYTRKEVPFSEIGKSTFLTYHEAKEALDSIKA